MSQYVNPAINVTIEDGHVVLAENENAMLDNPCLLYTSTVIPYEVM